MSIALGFTCLPDETFEQAVTRISGKYGLQSECLAQFHEEVTRGVSERDAAWDALYDWDVLDIVESR